MRERACRLCNVERSIITEEMLLQSLTPDDQTFRALASLYANRHKSMFKGNGLCRDYNFPGAIISFQKFLVARLAVNNFLLMWKIYRFSQQVLSGVTCSVHLSSVSFCDGSVSYKGFMNSYYFRWHHEWCRVVQF